MRLVVYGVAASILVLAGIAIWMNESQDFEPRPPLPHHFRSPVVAMELVRSSEEIHQVLCDPIGSGGWWNRRVMRQQIWEDWPFIVAYTLLFAGLGSLLFRCRWPLARAFGAVVVLTATAAALCDVFEDLGILQVLDTDPGVVNDAMARTIRSASLAKWGLLAVAELATAPLFLSYERGRVVPRVASALAGLSLAAAGLLGVVGLRWNFLIEWSGDALALGLLLALPALLFTPGGFLQGVGAADPDEPGSRQDPEGSLRPRHAAA